MAGLAYPRIGGPPEAHNAGTEAMYRLKQREQLRQLKAAMPFRPWPDEPWLVVGNPRTAEINAGRWVVRCDCGNAPSASPEWQLALCWDCAAIYEGVLFPEVNERMKIEAALLARPEMRNRMWRAPETSDDLVAENIENGVAA